MLKCAIVGATVIVRTLATRHEGHGLVIACQGGASTLDSMMRDETTAMTWQRRIFDNFMVFDCEGNVQPWLATGGHLDPTTRRSSEPQGVTLHDGSALTVEDVALSSMRASTHPRSEMRVAVGGIAAANLASAGPYTVVSSLAEDHLNLQAQPGDRDDAPAFGRVRLEVIASGATRVAALLSGEIDIGVTVLPPDLPRVANETEAYANQAPDLRLIYPTRSGS